MSNAGISTEELRAAVREFLEAECDLIAVRQSADRPAGHLDVLWRKMAELGWLGLAIDERHGGLGLGLTELGAISEELGRALVPLPVGPTLLAGEAIRIAGSATQQAQWLPPLAAGTRRASLVLPAVGPTLALDSQGGLHGMIECVLDADRVDDLLLPVRDSAGRWWLAIIARESAGVHIESRPAIDLTRTLADITLSGVSAGPETLMALEDRSWSALIDRAAVLTACDAIGGATHILERTIAYLGTRVQFDRPIGSFQALKHRAATWKILVESVTALTRHAAELTGSADAESATTASSAKFTACDAYVAIAGDAVQLHGGIGFTWDHECHLFLKRAHLNAVLHGRSRQHRERLAALAFGDLLTTSHPEHRFLLAPGMSI